MGKSCAICVFLTLSPAGILKLMNSPFLFGAGTSSYQIEGAWNEDGKGPSIWDMHVRHKPAIYRQHTGDVACDHYHRMPEDVALMRQIGLQAYRFSVSWPRVLPQGHGTANEAGLAFYDRLVDELLSAGIKPFITLYHWELPWALHIRGGWMNPDIVKQFEEYTALVAGRLGDRVKNWITLNEPQVFIGLAYGNGVHAPGYKLSLRECLLAGHHAMLAHHRCVRALRDTIEGEIEIGSAPVGIVCQPLTESPEDIEAARRASFYINPPSSHTPDDIMSCLWNSAWWIDAMVFGRYPEQGLGAFEGFVPENAVDELAAVAVPTEVMGANMYHCRTVKASTSEPGFTFVDLPPGSPRTTMGWDITPDVLYWGGKFLYERYQLPMYVTENGTATPELVNDEGEVEDTVREMYLKQHVRGLQRAREEGVSYLGYFHWSLMDNFEWEQGYSQRFGMVYVDYQTQQRILKRTAKNYARIMRELTGAT